MTVFILCVLSEPLCPLWPKRFTSHKGHEEHEEDPPERRSVGRAQRAKRKFRRVFSTVRKFWLAIFI